MQLRSLLIVGVFTPALRRSLAALRREWFELEANPGLARRASGSWQLFQYTILSYPSQQAHHTARSKLDWN